MRWMSQRWAPLVLGWLIAVTSLMLLAQVFTTSDLSSVERQRLRTPRQVPSDANHAHAHENRHGQAGLSQRQGSRGNVDGLQHRAQLLGEEDDDDDIDDFKPQQQAWKKQAPRTDPGAANPDDDAVSSTSTTAGTSSVAQPVLRHQRPPPDTDDDDDAAGNTKAQDSAGDGDGGGGGKPDGLDRPGVRAAGHNTDIDDDAVGDDATKVSERMRRHRQQRHGRLIDDDDDLVEKQPVKKAAGPNGPGERRKDAQFAQHPEAPVDKPHRQQEQQLKQQEQQEQEQEQVTPWSQREEFQRLARARQIAGQEGAAQGGGGGGGGGGDGGGKRKAAAPKKTPPPLPKVRPLDISRGDEAGLTWSLQWQQEVRPLQSSAALLTNASSNSMATTDTTVEKMQARVDFSDMTRGWHPKNLNPDTAPVSRAKPLEVILMPHTHVDPGWIRTFDDYYQKQTKAILDTVTDFLAARPFRKFIWAEISFLQAWWHDATPDRRRTFRNLVRRGQMEIVTGGWVMTEEACSHYFSMVDQLIEGQIWVNETFGVVPATGWSVDPFGHTPTMAFINSKAGLKGMVIDRIHWRLKQQMQQRNELVFRWQQDWDTTANTAVLTHTLPFYLYDVHYTCGPDYAVCCQLDFGLAYFKKKLTPQCAEFGAKTTVRPIIPGYEQNAALQLIEQYRKQALLFKNNVVLHPIGGDFRYTSHQEIAAQLDSYTRIMKYINSQPELNVNVRFGTLRDYFNAIEDKATPTTYPTLTGHFMPYSDRRDHYWTGFYTTRTYLKRLSRELERILKSTEVLHALALAKLHYPPHACDDCGQFLTRARRELGILQHHDAITGTAKIKVVNDYVRRLKIAVNGLLDVASSSLASLVGLAAVDVTSVQRMLDLAYAITDDVLAPDASSVLSIPNTSLQPFSGPLRIFVSSPHVQLKSQDDIPVPQQLMPVFDSDGLPVKDIFALWFTVTVAPLSVVSLQLHATPTAQQPPVPTIQIAHRDGAKPSARLAEEQGLGTFSVEAFDPQDDVVVRSGDVEVSCDAQTGYLKSITAGGNTVHAGISFDIYTSRTGKDDHSGAYLFMPDGPAKPYQTFNGTVIHVIKGPFVSEVQVQTTHFRHTLRLFNQDVGFGPAVEIENTIDMSVKHETTVRRRVKRAVKAEEGKAPPKKKFEFVEKTSTVMKAYLQEADLVMRVKTDIAAGTDAFFDLNGFQVTRKVRREDVGINGQYMPATLLAFVQDSTRRLTLHTNTALGMASLAEGQLEAMVGRTHSRDDNLGLGEGIAADHITTSKFVLHLEAIRPSSSAVQRDHVPSPSLQAHTISDRLNFAPMLCVLKQQHEEQQHQAQLSPVALPAMSPDMHLVQLRSIVGAHPPHASRSRTLLVLHRRRIACLQARSCLGNTDAGTPADLEVDLSPFLGMFSASSFEETSLTGVMPRERSSDSANRIQLPQMDMASIVVHSHDQR
ncbi:hypothetical protein PTSG_03147 [Salpingoeca rosetta]|uniref:Glycoside hydrolase family 38 central domain-containing protein n=1 Tax=Salpingoeca rosetta (strain ATCC 50818 / BSB-021) TaxID=946362 RepID=F2U4D3_SALR5|nr:uncharacterized protein PTSG_03147 [Salpingoeca rosetta]EGD82499.1 hypothetical protein PTSG_03147 [Salpingoeca rosetta]|eukprot:XP_004995735.1 hypothetical protein PTSG_03147 [Salpingoeca rosetta]